MYSSSALLKKEGVRQSIFMFGAIRRDMRIAPIGKGSRRNMNINSYGNKPYKRNNNSNNENVWGVNLSKMSFKNFEGVNTLNSKGQKKRPLSLNEQRNLSWANKPKNRSTKRNIRQLEPNVNYIYSPNNTRKHKRLRR